MKTEDSSSGKLLRLTRRSFLMTVACAVLVSTAAFAAGPPADVLNAKNPKVAEVMALQNLMTPDMMKLEGILGTATGLDDNGNLAVVIFVNVESKKAPEIMAAMPKAVKNTPIKIELTTPFKAFGKPENPSGKPAPAPKVDHRAKQTPPIQLGTSGGWRFELANGYCCSGALGSLITKDGKQFILSNYHVFESDIVLGGNNRVATAGDPVIQPGLIDVGCNAANAQDVATLVVSHALPNSNVDAAIAEVIPGMVSADGAILEIGTISSTTASPFVGQAVKKSGRTTGLTRSKVTYLNSTVSVAYENECAGDAAFTKTFTGQIIIQNRRSAFLAGGDSGSLMVEDVATNPKAVGLLFAGSSTMAVANPIGEVLNFFGATMVGN